MISEVFSKNFVALTSFVYNSKISIKIILAIAWKNDFDFET